MYLHQKTFVPSDRKSESREESEEILHGLLFIAVLGVELRASYVLDKLLLQRYTQNPLKFLF